MPSGYTNKALVPCPSTLPDTRAVLPARVLTVIWNAHAVLAAQEYVPEGQGTGGVVEVAQKWPMGHGAGAVTPAKQT